MRMRMVPKVMRWLCLGLSCVALSCVALSQSPPMDWATAPLTRGRLVIWIVHPARNGWQGPGTDVAQVPTLIPKTTVEMTAGSFGQASSDVGQTSGSYGRGPASLGTDSSNVGQTAGSYGQTAGSYGEGLSTIASAGQLRSTSSRLSEKKTTQWPTVVMQLHGDFPGLEIVVSDVHEEDLRGDLAQVSGSADEPDVLLGSPLPWVWADAGDGSGARYVLSGLGAAAFPAQVEDEGVTLPGRAAVTPTQVAIVGGSRHMDRARAFSVWLSDGGICFTCRRPGGNTAEGTATSALEALLAGGDSASNADPDKAEQDGDWAKATALEGLRTTPLDGLKIRTDVIRSVSNDRMAMVEMRAVAQVTAGYGVLHALAVLRKDAGGQWKVLQMTPDLSVGMVNQAAAMVAEFCSSTTSTPARVMGISQAAPKNATVVSPEPELWWDNGGGATMQVVEWQRGRPGQWSGTRLFFVPDRDPHLRTRVSAEFARDEGLYRWRVWSVAPGGVVVLSPWKTMNVVK
jgi:hypothetical protein